jgi:lysophospholipase L1-like esterase
MDYWFSYLIILLVGVVLFLGPIFMLRRRTRKLSGRKALIENISLSLLVLFLTLMAVEFYFKVFFAQSDGFRYTLASQNWYNKYWHENSLGYRDHEWTPEQLNGKTKVMVVGDSLTAGSGIVNPEDRFADQLGRLLGQDYVVFNVASIGWDTIDEVEAIIEYPYKPDLLILSYYINDIEGVAYESGAQRPKVRQDPPAWLLPLVQNSYAANFAYWRLVRLGPQSWANVYWNDWLKKIAADDNIRWRHQQELLTIVDGANSEQIPLMVVVFPNMAAVEQSRPFVQPSLLSIFLRKTTCRCLMSGFSWPGAIRPL